MKFITRSILAAAMLAFAGLAAAPPPVAAQDVRVEGYYRKNGTYVQPHYRSRPDGNTSNNWSTRGNVNPYTGKAGTKDPYGGSTLGGSTLGGGSSTYGGSTLGLGNRRRGKTLLGQ